jgi:lysyl-tRNA synthetase class 2
MLEWYRVGWDHRRADRRSRRAAAGRARARRPPRGDRESSRTASSSSRAPASIRSRLRRSELHDALADFGVCTDGLSRDDWLNLILTHRIEPTLDLDTLTFVYDFPPSQAALAKIRYHVRRRSPSVSRRTSARSSSRTAITSSSTPPSRNSVSSRISSRVAERGDRVPPLDAKLIDALAHGLPACAGVALGVERLLMAMLGTREIADVLAFPFDRS